MGLSNRENFENLWADLFTQGQQARDFQRRAVSVPTSQARNARTQTPSSTLPRVRGVTLTAEVNGIKAVWTDPLVTDLQAYEIQVSNNVAFAGTATANQVSGKYLESFESDKPRYLIPALDPDNATYYVRVRVRGNSGDVGVWSASASIGIDGTIGTGAIIQGAINKIFTASDSSWGTLLSNGTTTTDTESSTAVTITSAASGDYIIIAVQLDAQFDSSWGAGSTANELEVELMRYTASTTTAAAVDAVQFDFKSTVPTNTGDNARNIINATYQPDAITADGSYSYFVRLNLTSGGTGVSLEIIPSSVDLSAQQIRA